MTIKKYILSFLKAATFVVFVLCATLFPDTFEGVGDGIKTLVTQQPASVSGAMGGVGGADYTVLAEDFLHTEGNYVCDGSYWKLDGDRTIVTYASSTKIGTTFQFDFTPTGVYAANTQFGRTRVYEVSFGSNSYQHLLVKNLQDNTNIGLYGEEGELRRGRLNMGFSLSSTTPNTTRIQEIVVSSNLVKLRVTVNGKVFETEEFQVNNNEKYDVVYLALIDTSEKQTNQTGLLAPELRICP